MVTEKGKEDHWVPLTWIMEHHHHTVRGDVDVWDTCYG